MSREYPMDAFKALVIGWSIVWAAGLVAFGNLRTQSIPIPILSMGLANAHNKALYLIPLYAGAVWVAGCVLIAAVCFADHKISLRSRTSGKQPANVGMNSSKETTNE